MCRRVGSRSWILKAHLATAERSVIVCDSLSKIMDSLESIRKIYWAVNQHLTGLADKLKVDSDSRKSPCLEALCKSVWCHGLSASYLRRDQIEFPPFVPEAISNPGSSRFSSNRTACSLHFRACFLHPLTESHLQCLECVPQLYQENRCHSTIFSSYPDPRHWLLIFVSKDGDK